MLLPAVQKPAFQPQPSGSFIMSNSIKQLVARQALPQKHGPVQPRTRTKIKPGLTSDRADLAIPQPRQYTRLSIVSNAKGESILFAFDDANFRLTIWLPSATAGQWLVYEPEFSGSPLVQDFDLISNHLQGRKDDTLDMAVIAYNSVLGYQPLYFPALPFSTRVEDWQAYFSRAIDLMPSSFETRYAIRLGLLPKARRSVFVFSLEDGVPAAVRCDVDGSGQIAGYPFDLGPEWRDSWRFPVFEPCVAARQPASFTFDDGLVGAYEPVDDTGVVKVMLPKAPLGDAWELTPLPPLPPSVGFPNWLPVTNMTAFRRIDTGEPIITYVMSGSLSSPLTKAVWVMDNHTLYHSDQGCWWLAAPPDQVFPPPSWTPVRALPVQMQAGKPPTWIWLQLGHRRDPKNPYAYALIESRSTEFFNEGATNQWLAGSASYFDASLAASPTAAEETVARIFLAAASSYYYPTERLTVATLDNASGQWQYQDVPVPPPPASQP
jgi:hypothetical protein